MWLVSGDFDTCTTWTLARRGEHCETVRTMNPFRCLAMRAFLCRSALVPVRQSDAITPKEPGSSRRQGLMGCGEGWSEGESLRVRGGGHWQQHSLPGAVRPAESLPLWHIISAPLPHLLPRFPFTSDQNSPWHHSASPGNDLVVPLWTRPGCALARLGWPKKKVPERTGGLWSLQGGSAGKGTSASLS